MENIEVQLITTTAGAARAATETQADMLLISARTATIASTTITFPEFPRKNQSFGVAARSAVTTITTQAFGRTVDRPLTSLPAGGGFAWWLYVEEENFWMRVG